MPDQEFVYTFGRLAHAQLKDKAPMLLKHAVGFQVLDKNDDDTKAVGIYGFEIGDTKIYAPVFFLNGDIKGLDLMYVKNQDMFVPMQENWINYMINRQSPTLGKQAPVDILSKATVPELQIFRQAPRKTASAVLEQTKYDWIDPQFRDALVIFLNPVEELEKRSEHIRNLPTALAQSGLIEEYIEMMTKDAELCEATLRFYTVDDFRKAEEACAPDNSSLFDKQAMNKEVPMAVLAAKPGLKAKHDIEKVENLAPTSRDNAVSDLPAGPSKTAAKEETMDTNEEPGPEKGVSLVEKGDDVQKGLLKDPEKEELLADGYILIDERGPSGTRSVYKGDYERLLQNPDESGYYDVLVDTGEFSKMLVVKDPYTFGRPAWKPGSVCVVVNDGKGNILPSGDVYTSKKYPTEKTNQPELSGKNIEDVEVGKTYVFVHPKGHGTYPARIEFKQKDIDGSTQIWVNPVYDVENTDHFGRNRLANRPQVSTHVQESGNGIYERPALLDRQALGSVKIENSDWGGGWPNDDSQEVKPVNTGKDWEPEREKKGRLVIVRPSDGFRVTYIRGTTILPRNFKAVPISGKMKPNTSTSYPGAIADLYTGIRKVANDISIISNRELMSVKVNGHRLEPLKPAKVAFWLAAMGGVSGKEAKELVKEAKENGRINFWVSKSEWEKRAVGRKESFLGSDYPNSTTDPDLGVRVVEPYKREEIIEQSKADLTPYKNQVGPGSDDEYGLRQRALQSSRTGQKEVFDTAVVGSMVRSADAMSRIDDYIKDIILGMDRIGRILFMFYWHNEDFSERYGKQEMVELEENLRNNFKSTGDLVMFLKQRTLDTAPGLLGADTDAGENL